MQYKTVILFFVVSSFILLNAADAKPKKFKVRKEDSQVEFSITKWAIFKEEGRFKDFEGSIIYDPQNPAGTIVDFIVYAGSVDSRNEGRDNVIKSNEFFYTAKYPTLTFKSMQVQPKGKDSLLVHGVLTMRGVAKNVAIPVKVAGLHYMSEIGTMVGFETSFTVNREEYGIAKNFDIIGKEATIHLLIGASSKD
ncbi:MAG: YceI family protein [Bacteroidetes bacterium]|nr:MAG: YceI family protein [Bacteroidota bacterium]